MKAIRGAHLEFRDEVEVEVPRFVTLRMHQKSSTPNLFANEEETCDDVSEQRCSKTVTFVAFIDTESRQQRNWLGIPSGPLR